MPETPSETTQRPKKRPSGRPFVKGGPPGPGRGHKNPEKLLPMGADVYSDMKTAYEYPPSADDTEGVKAARRFMKEDYKGFIVHYTRLSSPQQVAAAATEVETEEVGPREERVIELAERLLKEWELEGK